MPFVTIYRWITFLLAGGYVIRMILFSDYDEGLGPLRYLTIWALIGSFFCASRMMALLEYRSERRWDGFISAVAVINAMVVILYWRLYFDDPTSVTRDGTRAVWYLDYYLHGLGPALQICDALFIHRSFRRPATSALWLVGIVAVYLLWSEFVVQPMHSSPAGSVTSGLPYPFLNNLALTDRLGFYATNIVTALVLLAVFAGLAWAIRRALPRGSEDEAAPPDSLDSEDAHQARS
ncbi:hypothetical protein AAD018_001535 [Aestuariibius insulae]|uniref:hypothetical protein n=1 Tax=Aestuariibius insulae TaxID=2058287 RepID=UPI00345EC343